MFGKWSRRTVLKSSGLAAAVPVAALTPAAAQAQSTATVALPRLTGHEPDNIFSRIGVRPIVNARGTYTIISGSRSLPEVKRAMFEAGHYYVHMDEMMDGIGKRLAELTGAEWGITTTGCQAAICLATIACIAGTDVEKCQALPYVKAKDQVIIPSHSRNPYDIGVRMVGAQVIEVETADDLRAQLNDRTAMIYVMAGNRTTSGPMSVAAICAIARERGVPVFVDAAAEELTTPNVHLAAGATLVGYSGGKCLRGPQSSGLLIGDKSLCQAAWYQASPHHAYGRAFKCSKEEAMGLLAAVEQWYKRDHVAEQKMWRGWLEHVAARLKPLRSTEFEYLEPGGLSNRAPRLRVRWDAAVLGITGTELAQRLDAGAPRILLESGQGRRPDAMASSLTIMPYMMDAGEERIVADAIYTALTTPGTYPNPDVPMGAMAAVAGSWNVTVHYPRGQGEHSFILEQKAGEITGQHRGELYRGPVRGLVRAGTVEIRSTFQTPCNNVNWVFRGHVSGNRMSGTAEMGEYGPATWEAVKT